MRVLFVQNTRFLNGQGGTEKICTFLANGFFDAGHQVEIATNENVLGKSVFFLNSKIPINNVYDSKNNIKVLYKINSYRGYNPLYWMIEKFKKKYRKHCNRKITKKCSASGGVYLHNLAERSRMWSSFFAENSFDLIITMSITSLLEISYLNHLTAPIINSTNGRPDYDYSELLWFREEAEKNALKAAYRNLKGIQVLFESYTDYLPNTFSGTTKVIPNPVAKIPEEEAVDHYQLKKRYTIVHVGSLVTSCKQQDVAIEIFSEIAHIYPNWDLHFWGTGDDYNQLSSLIAIHNLNNRVFLNGYTSSPLEKMKESDVFLFPSKYEGFPLSLMEAMSVGLPVLGFSYCSGVNELITDGENGFLCKDRKEMTNRLQMLLSDSTLRAEMGRKAYLFSKIFKPQEVLDKWLTFAENIVREKANQP